MSDSIIGSQYCNDSESALRRSRKSTTTERNSSSPLEAGTDSNELLAERLHRFSQVGHERFELSEQAQHEPLLRIPQSFRFALATGFEDLHQQSPVVFDFAEQIVGCFARIVYRRKIWPARTGGRCLK